MSVDLLLTRDRPLSWLEAHRACTALSEAHPGLLFWSTREDEEGCTAYFWKVGRVEVAMSPADPDAPEPELGNPQVLVSSRRGAWPWIEWLALALAKALDARVFDPQSGEFYEEGAPEHELADLLRLHQDDLRDRQPRLVSDHWAFERTTDLTPAALRRSVEIVEEVVHAVLGIPPSIALSTEQLNVSHRYPHPLGDVRLSIFSSGDAARVYNVCAPAGAPLIARLVEELGRRLGVRFRGLDAYE